MQNVKLELVLFAHGVTTPERRGLRGGDAAASGGFSSPYPIIKFRLFATFFANYSPDAKSVPVQRTALAQRSAKLTCVEHKMVTSNENDQADRAISTGKLHTLPRFHTQPINVVVFHGSQGNTRFEGGFPLRCFQRLSCPYIATLQCGWRHNRSTRGTSIPVLSY